MQRWFVFVVWLPSVLRVRRFAAHPKLSPRLRTYPQDPADPRRRSQEL
jgi:hypothetical protein